MSYKRTNRPKWGTTDPRPVNQRRNTGPALDPETGLPPVRRSRPPSRAEVLKRARRKHGTMRQGR